MRHAKLDAALYGLRRRVSGPESEHDPLHWRTAVESMGRVGRMELLLGQRRAVAGDDVCMSGVVFDHGIAQPSPLGNARVQRDS